MKIYRIASEKRLGYKAVGYKDGQAYSLYGGYGTPIDITVGSWMNDGSPKGFFLGSSKEYVLDYYSGLTDDDELLLTYEYDKSDVVGDSWNNNVVTDGEVRVTKARLVNVEPI
ncbi:MAG: hypothetical protein ACW986_19845 [Promethearchaeota archaeon]